MARLDRLTRARRWRSSAPRSGASSPTSCCAASRVQDEPRLHAALAQLVDAELLYQRGTPPAATYTFKHALIQDDGVPVAAQARAPAAPRRASPTRWRSTSPSASRRSRSSSRGTRGGGTIARGDRRLRARGRAGPRALGLRGGDPAPAPGARAAQDAARGPERDAREPGLQTDVRSLGRRGARLRERRNRSGVRARACALRRSRGCPRTATCTLFPRPVLVGIGADRAREHVARSGARERGGGSDTDLALDVHSELGSVEYFQGRFASPLAHCTAALALIRRATSLGPDRGPEGRFA